MKYILVNPEEFIMDIKPNGNYGKNGFITRINFGKSEPELDFASKFAKSVNNKVNGTTKEANLAPVFEYQNYDISPKLARARLHQLVDIVKFDHNEDGEEVVYVRYMSVQEIAERTENEKEASIKKWNELENKLKLLSPKEYSLEEKSKIVNYVLHRYTQDLSERDEIVFESNSHEAWLENRDPKKGDSIRIGGSKQFLPEIKAYFVNGEHIIVSTYISSEKGFAVPPDYRMNSGDYMCVEISRKSLDGQYENFARFKKYFSKEFGNIISCSMGGLTYHTSDKTSALFPSLYSFSDSSKSHENFDSLEAFETCIKQMIPPEDITKLYEVFLNKIRFQFPSKSKQHQKPPIQRGIREVGSWPDEKPALLDFKEIMFSNKISDPISLEDSGR